MLKTFHALTLASALLSSAATAQVAPPGFNRPVAVAPAPAVVAVPVVAVPVVAVPISSQAVLPSDTIIQVTSSEEISSIGMKEGTTHMLQTAADVGVNGVVVIPRGAPVKGTITYRTGKGIGGKSAKFEITFNSVSVGGRDYALKGKHRQEGKGNTVGALLGSMFISGRSAIITSGQILNAFTAEPISAS